MARRARFATRALRLVMLVIAGCALLARGRTTPTFQAVLDPEDAPPQPASAAVRSRPAARSRPRSRGAMRPRRIVATFGIAICFFAGAALSAGAGDRAALLLDDVAGPNAAPAETTDTTEPSPAPAQEEAPAEEELAPPTLGAATVPPEPELSAPAASAPAAPAAPAEPAAMPEAEPPAARLGSESTAPAHVAARADFAAAPRAPAARREPVAAAPRPVRPSLEQASGVVSGHTLWLARPYVETPPALRLTPDFAEQLRSTARRHGTRWSIVFGVLRARGDESAVPASARELDALAVALSGADLDAAEISAALGRPAGSDFGERAAALARYARAVGLDTLVDGLERSRVRLGERILADERIDLYPGGREDVVADRIDPRVLALVAYLAETYGQVTVSSLTSGHRLYARPGVMSAHVFGQAVDIAAVGGIPVLGNQQPGGVVEHAVRSILRLPSDLRPEQVISLLGLGGPSFPLADHYDHIHVGF